MKFFFLKVWAKKVSAHYTQQNTVTVLGEKGRFHRG